MKAIKPDKSGSAPTVVASSAVRRRLGRLRRGTGLLVAGLVGLGALTACDGTTSTPGEPATGQPPSVTATEAPDDTGTGGPSDGATNEGASDGPSTDAPSTDKPSGGVDSADGTTTRVAWCETDDLEGRLTDGEGGAAGSTMPYLVLQNTSSDPCRIQGWPGASFVGGDDGTQLGAAATMDRSSPHDELTIKPNGHVHAPLRVANAENYPASECDPQDADGLRVYPPGNDDSLFVPASGMTACAKDDVELLEVQGLQPGVG